MQGNASSVMCRFGGKLVCFVINRTISYNANIHAIVQTFYWINLELIVTRGFFADFSSAGTLEHHIKNVSKSTLGKLRKIVVLKHRVSYLHGNKAWNKLLTFKPTHNKNITVKLSTHITEILNKQYL